MLTAAAHILDSIANPVTETLKTEVSLKPSHWIRNNKTRSKLAQQTSDKIKVYLFPSAPSCIVFFFSLSWISKAKISSKGNDTFPLPSFFYFFMAGSQKWYRVWEGSFCPRKITWLFPKKRCIQVLRKEITSHSYDQAIKMFIPKSNCQVILQSQLVSYRIYYYMVMITSYASKTSTHKTKLGFKNTGW